MSDLWPATAGAEMRERSGKISAEIVSRLTLTRVVIASNAASEREHCDRAEQIWTVEHGAARSLIACGGSDVLAAGNGLITLPSSTRNVENTGEGEFIYFTVTTPPQGMSGICGQCGQAARG